MSLLRFSLLPLLFLCLFSCSSDFDNLPKSDFAPHELTEWDKPFTGIWVDPQAQDQKINEKKLFIKPISLDYLNPPLIDTDKEGPDKVSLSFTHQLSLRKNTYRNEKVKKLATYFDEQLSEKIKANPTTAARVADDIKKAQFIVEPALVKVRATKSGWNLLSFGTSLVVPMVSYAFSPFTYGDMALMIKVSDSKTGKVYGVFADYKKDQPSVFGSIRDYSPYAHHRRTIDVWTSKMVDLLAAKPGEEVEKPLWITLNPF